MSKKIRKFSSGFKAKLVIEALKERQTLQDLASKYELHSSQIINLGYYLILGGLFDLLKVTRYCNRLRKPSIKCVSEVKL